MLLFIFRKKNNLVKYTYKFYQIMKNQIKVGPIQKRKAENSAYQVVRKQMNKMKLGEFFEINGVNDQTVYYVRAALSYYSKRDGLRVSTTRRGNKLTVERVRR